nr:hypothetical protein [Tanacetum cinerariifolium]
MAEGEIDNLTMKQYLALTRENQAPGVVKPEIRGNVNFEIRSQFMRELRDDTFSRNKNDDAHEHVERVLVIVRLFNILGASHDAVMLCVLPTTLTGAAKRWVDRLPPGIVDSWDLLKKAFIQRYCPPSKTAKQLKEIHNFKQKGDEILYQAWERYNDLLYKCHTHDINNHQNVNIFYNGLGDSNHQLLDSQWPIPGMTHVQALTTIQTMADHSQKWHDGSSSRNIESSSNSEGIVAIVNKLENLDCPLKEEVNSIEEAKYSEFGRPSPFSNEAKYCVGPPGYYTHMDNCPPVGEKRPSLEELMNKHIEESTRRRFVMEEWVKKLQENAKINTQNQADSLINLETQIEQLTKEFHTKAANEINSPSLDQYLGVSVNVIPKFIFKHLKLALLKKTDMLVEMADMTKRSSIGIVENVLVKIDKFLFPSDFVVMDMLNTRNETMILRRPFIATIHAEIDVFNREISFEIGGFRYEEIGIRGLLDSYSCGSKVLSWRNHLGETRVFYGHFARSQLLQLSLGEENNTQGSLLL